MRDRIRVAVYVFSHDIQQKQDYILVFDHVDFPTAGTQIPAGGVEVAETLEAAAIREVREETGVIIHKVRSLGVQITESPIYDMRNITVYFFAQTEIDPRQRWIQHVLTTSGADAGMQFSCYFVPMNTCEHILKSQGYVYFELIPAEWKSPHKGN